MKKAKAPRVPVLENAFEVNLPKLMRTVRATGDARAVLDDGVVRTVAVVTEKHVAVFLGGRQWVVDIVPVQCLRGRVRPLLKCPRAHEGNFQSLYFRGDELACRHCHALRYRTTVAATAAHRAQLAREKLLRTLGAEQRCIDIARPLGSWRKRHLRLLIKVARLTRVHYEGIHSWIHSRNENPSKIYDGKP